jgi:microcystin-dependent protein
MAFSITHDFVSGKSDGLDTSFVQPSNWNADHEVVFDDDDAFIGRAAGAGPGAGTSLSLTQYTVPLGAIVAQAHSTLPSNGWLWCNGQLVNRVTYAALFGVLSTTYGAGDGSTTFGLPDLRGRSISGLDNMGGVASASRLSVFASTTLGTGGGTQSMSGSASVSVTGFAFTAGIGISATAFTGGLVTTPGNNSTFGAAGGGFVASEQTHTHQITANAGVSGTVDSNAGVTGSGSGTCAITQVSPTMVMNLIIRY